MEQKIIRNVSDIIDINYLQRIQDSLGRVTKITTALLDTQGVPLTAPTNLYAFCAMMQASDKGIAMCMRTNGELIRINQETRGPAIVTCPNSGLKTAAVPIFLKDQYLGSWLIGQMRTDEIDEELIEQTSMEAGLSAEEAKANMAVLPVISEAEFQDILEFLTVITAEIVSLVEMNDALDERNKALEDLSAQVSRSLELMNQIVDLTDVGVFATDFETGEFLLSNTVYRSFLASLQQKDPAYNFSCLLHQMVDYKEVLLTENKKPAEPHVYEQYFEDIDKWLRITNRAIYWVDGTLALLVTFFDITESKKHEERISYLAYYDQRLDIPNCTRLSLDLYANMYTSPYLIAFDIKGLRKINDAYNRDMGDRFLEAVKDWLEAFYPQGTVLYRLDGDSFALLIDAEEPAVMQLAQQIYNRFKEPWLIELDATTQTIVAEVYIGVVPAKQIYADNTVLIDDLERILAAARSKNAPLLYDAAVDKEFRRHLAMEMTLKECVLNHMQGFSLMYQPIVEPETFRWVGLEALCRWNAPGLGNIPPMIFIGEAEELGLIDILGEWVVQTALRQTKEWGLDDLDDFVLNVNLSPLQLNGNWLYDTLPELLTQRNFPASKLSLEITESAEVHFDAFVINSLNRVRDLGVMLSLDDFGTGYASFASLSQMPVTVLKTDRSFVTNIETDEYLQKTVRIMVDFAHAAGMHVIAEGVETERQMEMLKEIGVDFYQGYWFAKPLSVADVAANLHRFAR